MLSRISHVVGLSYQLSVDLKRARPELMLLFGWSMITLLWFSELGSGRLGMTAFIFAEILSSSDFRSQYILHFL